MVPEETRGEKKEEAEAPPPPPRQTSPPLLALRRLPSVPLPHPGAAGAASVSVSSSSCHRLLLLRALPKRRLLLLLHGRHPIARLGERRGAGLELPGPPLPPPAAAAAAAGAGGGKQPWNKRSAEPGGGRGGGTTTASSSAQAAAASPQAPQEEEEAAAEEEEEEEAVLVIAAAGEPAAACCQGPSSQSASPGPASPPPFTSSSPPPPLPPAAAGLVEPPLPAMPSGSASPSPQEEPPQLAVLLPPPPRPPPGLLLQYHHHHHSTTLMPHHHQTLPPPSPSLPDTLLLRDRLAGLGLRERGGEAAPTSRDLQEEEEEEDDEEAEAPEGDGGGGDLELDLEEPPEEDGDGGGGEEELLLLEPAGGGGGGGPASLLLLSSPGSPPLLPPGLGSVLLPPPPLSAGSAFEAQEAAGLGGALYGPGDDVHHSVMAAMLSQGYGPPGGGGEGVVAAGIPPGPALSGEQAALLRRKSVNTTECVPVPSSEHVAEIVGRQGCKIKALRAKTNTYIKTPVRGEEPIFVVTGRKEDVAMAKREILSAAEHFSMIRASRNKNGPALGGLSCNPNLPGQTTVQVRVPYRVVGLVVGPKGATIKRIQQQTHTYIVTPSRDKEPVFEVTGMPENVDRAREEIEMHIAMRTGNYIELNEENDFHYNGTDVSFEGGNLGSAWLTSNPVPPPSRTRMISNYRNDSSSSLGSGSTDSYFGSNRLADFSPTSPFNTGNFWFGETLPSVGAEDLAVDSSAYDSLPTPSQTIWTPFEPVNPLSSFGSEPASNVKAPQRESQPSTPRLSPTFPETLEHPLARRVRSDPPGTVNQVGLPIYIPAFSNGTNSYSSSNGGSTSSSPPELRRKHDCVICFENEVIAALVPCGHNLFCMECANKICEKEAPMCPVCQTAVTQAIQIHS
ncbi:RNA-binding E3 ubiquitin-protein ligase MEX3C [Rhineura floridana]|uniref:RNA-binding E3 ubiquitin-protein ligase MEX3C n=1 Tax=Rhineura floridana TaxID=261503 RepID=UPI002AC7FEE2|nr:RNA-binding E3 ubiquitin-protein ligase MEX3C [Rhineura floridana]